MEWSSNCTNRFSQGVFALKACVLKHKRSYYFVIGLIGFLTISNLTGVELQRTACLGICPVYTLQVWGNGLVTYHGELGLVKGDRTSFISPIQAWRLFMAVKAFQLTHFDPIYTNGNTDYEGSRTCLGLGPLTDCVLVTRDHRPDLKRQPNSLLELNRFIDEVTNSVQWTGTPEQIYEQYAHPKP
jgi:hypothetical protein